MSLQGHEGPEPNEKAAMVAAKKGGEIRKGPWTEQEDLQLVWLVGLFGERRWDFLAKVSGLRGLNRTGKSCRLRWVNYLHPGLKRGRMTPQEEELILELHSKWGNRFDPIKTTRKLPGRTDNEIKNYWRTHMRKKAQELRKTSSPSSSSPSSSSSSSTSSSSNTSSASEGPLDAGAEKHECESNTREQSNSSIEEDLKVYPMDQLWNEIAASEPFNNTFSFEEYKNEGVCSTSSGPSMPSPIWEYSTESLWRINDDEEELKMFIPDLAFS
ncbi:Transcription factor MYB59 [Ananas comosus]|uniref:Transcription factor MYB59 n=1 Tax=Ananas comosus TaxID=4615 RepID=A0A199V5H2_ANACO|nr:Transcription factor MYB59 [Ananas comosus]